MNEPAITPHEPWPDTIRLFVAAYLGMAICGTINALLQYDSLSARIMAQAHLAAPPPASWVYAIIAVRLAIVLAILAWAVLGRSLIARLLTGAQLISWLWGAPMALRLVGQGNAYAIAFTIGVVCAIAATAILFTPTARQWFAAKAPADA